MTLHIAWILLEVHHHSQKDLVIHSKQKYLEMNNPQGNSIFLIKYSKCKFDLIKILAYWAQYYKPKILSLSAVLPSLSHATKSRDSRSQMIFKIGVYCNFNKKRLQHRCFPVKTTKFLPTAFFYRTPPVTDFESFSQQQSTFYSLGIATLKRWIFRK